MGRPMSYDGYAREYAQTRWAVPWVLAPLRRELRSLEEPSTVIEIGCGTGNYLIALAQDVPSHRYLGFDLSSEMLRVARSRSSRVNLARGNAEGFFPYADSSCRFGFAVDVIHHIEDLDAFFSEAARVIENEGQLIVVTDSERDIVSRSLTRHFPELVSIELDRYPTLDELHAAAGRAGLGCAGAEPCAGDVPLTEDFLDKLERKCSSGMRLMTPEAHRRGMERVRAAAGRGETWHSCYTAIRYTHRPARAVGRP